MRLFCHALHPATRALPGAHDANTQENPSKHTKKQKQKQTSTGSVYPGHGPRISRCLEVQRGDTQSRWHMAQAWRVIRVISESGYMHDVRMTGLARPGTLTSKSYKKGHKYCMTLIPLDWSESVQTQTYGITGNTDNDINNDNNINTTPMMIIITIKHKLQ